MTRVQARAAIQMMTQHAIITIDTHAIREKQCARKKSNRTKNKGSLAKAITTSDVKWIILVKLKAIYSKLVLVNRLHDVIVKLEVRKTITGRCVLLVAVFAILLFNIVWTGVRMQVEWHFVQFCCDHVILIFFFVPSQMLFQVLFVYDGWKKHFSQG